MLKKFFNNFNNIFLVIKKLVKIKKFTVIALKARNTATPCGQMLVMLGMDFYQAATVICDSERWLSCQKKT